MKLKWEYWVNVIYVYNHFLFNLLGWFDNYFYWDKFVKWMKQLIIFFCDCFWVCNMNAKLIGLDRIDNVCCCLKLNTLKYQKE